MSRWSQTLRYLELFLIDEIRKTGLKKAVVGVSGGIDSAVVAVLCQRAFGSDFLGVLLPSQYSSDNSAGDAQVLCEQFGMRYETVSIAPMVEGYCQNVDDRMRVGNFSARMRMAVLYDISARDGALVVGTSNKSELMLGYGTLFGDMASAVNPIGDLYKSEVYELARFLGVPDVIIDKPPTADLYAGQSDEADLGYTYAQIDEVLREYVEERKSEAELVGAGFDPKLVAMVLKRLYQNHFKRVPPVIAKLTSRTINHDFLYPRDIMLEGA